MNETDDQDKRKLLEERVWCNYTGYVRPHSHMLKGLTQTWSSLHMPCMVGAVKEELQCSIVEQLRVYVEHAETGEGKERREHLGLYFQIQVVAEGCLCE
jgi:hypothetical protein